MSYQAMAADDLSEVVALEARIQAHPWSVGNFRDALAAGYAGWTQRVAGRLAAFAVTMPVVDEHHLLVIGVAPERQREGVGKALLGFLLARAREEGATRMLLEVRRSNVAALAFYRAAGFTEIGCRRGYYAAPADSGGREDAIVMARQL